MGCQTNRPFGIAGESFVNPKYLDSIVESVAFGRSAKDAALGGQVIRAKQLEEIAGK